ncbi:3-oxoacyl-ACP reductase family protein [Nostoc sp. UIC 10630]|uniref:3-oxoacyl-ACP reductase family protein n=1 Tax=Nostoc sp. UIC 10630 TaxID=2100146 RepID=UPI0013D28651|nr:3-oxoacyl-ACP reductase family protein [Nostoc sp. UIC 10630]NEU80271.1 3-oxoacyl-ACP reductase FabG [Nostoc sp. UIC 10630]
MSTKKLTGKVALVTGGSRGLGAAIAKRLAKDGAAVALTYTSSPQKADEVVLAIETAGGQAKALRADSANVEAVKNAVADTVKAFGRLDILVNNAGVATLAPIDQFSMDDFDRLIAVNIKGVFVATQEAVRHMGEGGRIVMIGSVNSDIMPFAGGSVYALTKGAIASFTRGLARDLGPRGITVNNIQPGPIDTDMNPAEGPFADTMKSMIALQRYGRTEEVAEMVSYLASAEAGFITGASLKIDGGFSA